MPYVANPIPIYIGRILGFYSILLVLRILLSWFGGAASGRGWELLVKVTDPYLNLFRGIGFLKRGTFDFTIYFGIVVLIISQRILVTLGLTGDIRLSVAVAIVLDGVWRAVRWIMIFFAILGGIRAVGLYSSSNQTHAFWYTLDSIVRPLSTWFNRILNNRLDYAQALIGSVVFLLVAVLVGNGIVGFLTDLLLQSAKSATAIG